MYKQRTYIAGMTLEKAKYHTYDYQGARSTPRRKKGNVTPASVKKANDRNARNKLRRLLNSNFKDGHTFATLTYRDDTLPLTLREVRNDMSVFRRRLRAKAPDVKFVYVIELGADNRLHVHIVLDLPANSQIPEACWNKGHVNVKPMYGNGQYADLANYMIKSTEDTKTYAASLGEKHTQKYTCSRNLQKPEVHTEIITEREVMEPPEEITGYYIDKNSQYANISADGYLYAGCTYIKL